MEARGPLGDIAGMFFDPVTKRYYPNARREIVLGPSARTSSDTSQAGPSRPSSPGGSSVSRRRHATLPKVRRKDARRNDSEDGIKEGVHLQASPTPAALCTFLRKPEVRGEEYGASRRRGLLSRMLPSSHASTSQHGIEWAQGEVYANLNLEDSSELAVTQCEKLTHITTYPTGSVYATTDHGRLIMKRTDRRTSEISVCRGPLVGVHTNFPRMTVLTIAGGPSPHVHRVRRNVNNPDEWRSYDEAGLILREVFCMSSFGDLCTIGGGSRLVTLNDEVEDLTTMHASRKLPSDPLALHHAERNIVWAGLRNSQIIVEDLRSRSASDPGLARLKRGKAVVGVKRLKDSAVPYGLVASGMANELLLFDVRYGAEPVRSLPGHVNTYLSDLGMTTTFDDRFLFAAGSDCRIRAWDLTTGSRLQPTESDPSMLGPNSANPLTRVFDDRPRAMQMTEDGLLDVAVGRNMFRFSRLSTVDHNPMAVDAGRWDEWADGSF